MGRGGPCGMRPCTPPVEVAPEACGRMGGCYKGTRVWASQPPVAYCPPPCGGGGLNGDETLLPSFGGFNGPAPPPLRNRKFDLRAQGSVPRGQVKGMISNKGTGLSGLCITAPSENVDGAHKLTPSLSVGGTRTE